MLEQIIHWIQGLSKYEFALLAFIYILFILWLFISSSKSDEKKRNSFFWQRSNYLLAVDKKRFIIEIARWGLTNIDHHGSNLVKNKSINLEVSYYHHKKKYGIYYANQKKIKVYVNAHNKIDDMIDTTLHEVVHHFQYCSDPKNFKKKYDTLLHQCTYEKHPMEIEARSVAAKHVKSCFNYLIQQGYVKKAA